MATTVNSKNEMAQSEKTEEIKKRFDTPGREPDKALDGMFGLWQETKTTLEEIRNKKRRKKW